MNSAARALMALAQADTSVSFRHPELGEIRIRQQILRRHVVAESLDGAPGKTTADTGLSEPQVRQFVEQGEAPGAG